MRSPWIACAAVLALGGCGGSAAQPATPAATAAPVASADCARLEQVGSAVSGAGYAQAEQLLDAEARTGPREIRDDLKEIAGAYRQLATALDEAGGATGAAPSPQALRKLQQILSQTDQAGLARANRHVTAWVMKSCSKGGGSS